MGMRKLRETVCFVLTLSLAVLASCRQHAPPPQPYVAFVADSGSNSVAAVDLAAFRVSEAAPVAPGPRQLVVRPGRHELYVPASSGEISVLGFPKLRELARVRVARSLSKVVFSPDGSRAYALDAAAAELIFLECHTGVTPAVSTRIDFEGHPTNLVLTPDGKTLILADPSKRWLVFVDTASRQVLGSVDVGQAPGPMAVLPDGSKVFVANTGEDKISAVDVAARQVLSNIEISSKPTALSLKPDGGELFVFTADNATMTIVDTFHDYAEQEMPTGRNPVAAVARRDSSVLYVANAGDGTVTVVDIRNRQVLNTTQVGSDVVALALTPDERFLTAVDSSDSSLAVLRADPAARDAKGNPYLAPNRSLLVAIVSVGSKPVDVAVTDWLADQH
jgi:YVTN family beta-propeller protein